MTICFPTDGQPYGVGGISTFNNHLFALLLKEGHRVIAIHTETGSTGDDSISSNGFYTQVILRKTGNPYLDAWKPYFRPGGFDAPNWIAKGMATREWLLSNHKAYQIDIVEVADYGGLGIFLCDNSLPPVIITGHGSLFQFAGINYSGKNDSLEVITRLEELSCLSADAIITHSQLNKTRLEKWLKKPVRVTSMPWQYHQNRACSKVPGKFITIGGLQPVKGIYDLMDAMELLRVKAAPIQVTWIGGDTWLAPAYQQMSVYLQKKYPDTWQHRLIWAGELDPEKTGREIAAASLVIIPGTFDTFNYVALEAATHGKAILITGNTGAAELFTHGEDAWIIPSNNPAAMADAILYLSNHPELCDKLGANACTTIRKKLNEDRMVSERLSVYSDVIDNRALTSPVRGNELDFLNRYRTATRKYYYCLRRFFKKLKEKTGYGIIQAKR